MGSIVRSHGLECLDSAEGIVRWSITFTHVCAMKYRQQDTQVVQDSFVHKQYQTFWLQKSCGCIVTLQHADKQALVDLWAVQERLLGPVGV